MSAIFVSVSGLISASEVVLVSSADGESMAGSVVTSCNSSRLYESGSKCMCGLSTSSGSVPIADSRGSGVITVSPGSCNPMESSIGRSGGWVV